MIVDSFRLIRNTNTLRPKTCFFALLVRGHRPSSTHSYISYVWQGCVSVTTVFVVFYFPQSPPKTSKLFLEGRPKPTTSCPRWYERPMALLLCDAFQVYCKRSGLVPNSGFHSFRQTESKAVKSLGIVLSRMRFGRSAFEYCFCQIQENRKLFGIYYQYDLHIFTYHPLCHPATFEHHNIININININIIIIIIIIFLHHHHHHPTSSIASPQTITKQKTSTKYREQHHKNLNRTSTKSKTENYNMTFIKYNAKCVQINGR